ncbi:hypothetical protein CCH79_00020401 [Gambusia affinis]|uniref:Uncharacterized protein n=1 Tax=Gambusia affinis TaxID=33528 RepID=A0A315VZ62_GAMAF|nr:hypothetical protein CCH79_00020401 [Gambusia affinis]
MKNIKGDLQQNRVRVLLNLRFQQIPAADLRTLLVRYEPVLVDSRFTRSGRVPWRLIKAQVAVAMAVIRSRPPGVSGRQHGEALGRTLRRQDGVWRERAQALQEEVLRLRQELLVSRATANTNSSRETADEAIMEDLSQDLFGPGSPAFGADPPPDCDSETPDFLLQDPPFPLLLPLPLPPPPPPSRLQSDSWSDSLLPHMRFLQSLCSLQRLDGSSVALAPEGHGGSAASETIFLLLDSVAAACGAPPPPGLPDLLPQACRVASRALDLLCSGRPSADLQRCVEEALRELTRTLLHSQRPGRAAEKLTESLVALGSSSVSKSFLVCLILSEIGSLAEQLWQTSQVNTLQLSAFCLWFPLCSPDKLWLCVRLSGLISIFLQVQESSALRTFPLDQYQNSCHLLWVLESLLPGLDSAQRRPELEAAQTAFLHRLELRVFLLWDEFPLFSILMWRIGKLLF